ncbi:ABC transporter ATP-binding protein [Candidatus Endowatersipora endosymbiont of Watersipora subatra]|uniref:ABC transporter ATP-binding protein n=1 Tax=Candidatus Endowatersipora endosymbiont of Watersipora subatra TaxID=3077946 RepID=UPI00312C801D
MISNLNRGSGRKGDLLLEMRNVEVDGFSDERWHKIIKGVDLTLCRGEVIGLIGESGAGKSTLGLAAMGFARPGCKIKSGIINFNGINLVTTNETEKRKLWGVRISYVSQSAMASFNPVHRLIKQTVEVTIDHNLRSKKEAYLDAIELYESLQLPDPENIGSRYPHQVSGGQLQRIMTAMAISPRPDLIIFDEPTTALDVTTQVEVLAAMRHVVDRFNTAAIYITHDLAIVAQIADKIKVLRYGMEVEEAETHEMLFSPKEDYTKSLWSVRSIEKAEEKSDDILLSIQNVDAAYENSLKILNKVSISIPRGKTVAVVGESGSGKSTTARVMTGLLSPMSGYVKFDGETLPPLLKDRTTEQLRRIQMIYQIADTAMNPKQTVAEIIGRPLEFYHNLTRIEHNKRIRDLLEMIELDESFLNRLPSEMSGGQKQRICIARALAADPEIIICDEITSALDQIVQEGILKLLLYLQKELSLSYLFITHDITVVRAISDEIVVMHQGYVIEQGMKSAILSPPHPDYTELLLSSAPQMDPNWLSNLMKKRHSTRLSQPFS